MAILQKQRSSRPQIDLTGPAGNAYAVMGYARQYARELGRDPAPIIEEMMSGDYENLINVFDREFGEYVDLLR